MSFPSSPSNAQTAIVNGITYQYTSATNSWKKLTNYVYSGVSYANTVNSNNLIDTFSQVAFRSANYDIVVQNGSGYESTRLMVLQTDTDASILEFGSLSSSAYSLGNFSANVSGGFVNVYFSPFYTGNTTVTATRTTVSNTGIATVLVLNQTYDFNVVTLGTIDTQTLVNEPIDLNFT